MAVPAPVPRVSTISIPRPAIAPNPWTSASLRTRTGRPRRSASFACKSKPANVSVPRLGAVMMRPSRTYPGKPTDTRSKVPSGVTTRPIASMRSAGVIGLGGVSTRCRSPIMFPLSSRRAALIPVPPISFARVRSWFMAILLRPSLRSRRGGNIARAPRHLYYAVLRRADLPRVAGSVFGGYPFCRYTCRPRLADQADRAGARMRIIARFTGIGVVALMAALSAADARADGPPAAEDLVKASLVPETTTIAPGTTLWVDLHLEIKPGWHIYWRNPGDSGLPTAIELNLPPGFLAGSILWPAPEHFVQNGIGNYGYAGSANLLVPLAPPKQLATGQIAKVEADPSWLVCADICIPGGAKLLLGLPVAAQPGTADAAVAQLFAAA